MSEKGAFRVLFICLLVAAAFLGFAIGTGKQAAEFYSALRWVCCFTLLFAGLALVYGGVDIYRSCRKRDSAGTLIMVMAFHLAVAGVAVWFAILFNPIFPFQYSRNKWLFLDELCVGLIAFLCFAIYHRLALPPILNRRKESRMKK